MQHYTIRNHVQENMSHDLTCHVTCFSIGNSINLADENCGNDTIVII